MTERSRRLILASTSQTRARMLENAGLVVEAVPSGVDEPAVRDALVADNGKVDPADLAEVLARAKAEAVSARHPEALVIGGDQVLALGGDILAKPADADDARRSLIRLRGEVHELHSAVALAVGGECVWTHVDAARLTMRRFSMSFLADYLARVGDKALESVGAYQIEGHGAQLFEAVEGDHFTILGLPLLPLLAELRNRNVIGT